MSNQRIFKRIERLLDQEKATVLSGELKRLPQLITQKEALFSQIGEHPNPDPTLLKRLQQKTEQNQKILDAAMLGIRAATDRISEIRKKGSNLKTYSEQGVRAQFSGLPRQSFEKRA